MILKFKTTYSEAMPVMDAFLNNGYRPVMSINDEMVYSYTIAIDTDDVVNEDSCDTTKACTPDCPDFEECWGEDKDEEKVSEEEVANMILKALFESAHKNSRILNE